MVGCGGATLPADVEQSPEARAARGVIDALARRDFDTVVRQLHESQRTPDPVPALGLMAGLFPSAPAERVRLVGFESRYAQEIGGARTQTYGATFESTYPQTFVLSQVLLARVDGGDLKVLGLHANPLPAPLAVLNAFTFKGKGVAHYLVLLGMAAAIAVTVIALAVWVRRGAAVRRRGWWLAGILIGTFKLTLDWTTGAVALQALTVQLFSVCATRAGLEGPWMLALSIPAGAIAFLIRQRRSSLPASGADRGPATDAATPNSTPT